MIILDLNPIRKRCQRTYLSRLRPSAFRSVAKALRPF